MPINRFGVPPSGDSARGSLLYLFVHRIVASAAQLKSPPESFADRNIGRLQRLIRGRDVRRNLFAGQPLYDFVIAR